LQQLPAIKNILTTKSFFLVVFLISGRLIFAQANVAPVVEATGDQVYCPQTTIPVVTAFNITDPDDAGIEAIYIQISAGYISSVDRLSLSGSYPDIQASWDAGQGKLTLSATGGGTITYARLIEAVQDVVYQNTSAQPSGERQFSISVGDANYLPSTGHYYEYISANSIRWDDAKTAAEIKTYFGLQGYLATLTSQAEADFSGEQAGGVGWIGGTDEAQEGVWRWATGPEAGTIFWNGGANGSSPNYAHWNNGEPNNLNNEDYAHIYANSSDPNLNGTWNDLPIQGGNNNNDSARGYIVEYGGMPGDPFLQISDNTRITIEQEPTFTGDERCGAGTLVLSGQADFNQTINWYDTATSTTILSSGNDFNTPVITTTRSFYAEVSTSTCFGQRYEVVATVRPIAAVNQNVTLENCDEDGTDDGVTGFNLNDAELLIDPGMNPNLSYSYYTSQADAENGSNRIDTSQLYRNDTSSTVYARVLQADGCSQVVTVNLMASNTSFPDGYAYAIEVCDDADSPDGYYTFDLTAAIEDMKNQFGNPQDINIELYKSYEDALYQQGEVSGTSAYINEIQYQEILFARAENTDGTGCYGIAPNLRLTVSVPPQFDLSPQGPYCIEDGAVYITAINSQGNYTYQWTNENGNVLSNDTNFQTSVPGNYLLTVGTASGCSTDTSFTVELAQPLSISLADIEVVNNGDTSTLTVNEANLGIGDYSYSLDDDLGPYQDSNVFVDVQPGIHQLYVVDNASCAQAFITVPVLGFPLYLTPNGDGINDTWGVLGLRPEYYETLRMEIYDRFGKLLKVLLPGDDHWDGTVSGRTLPSSEYWYKAYVNDFEGNAMIVKGHFSLIRR
tara:strand:- start:11111 stop:13648 length:2538 start_codon:yes stop_codon:yes gene_type:complete